MKALKENILKPEETNMQSPITLYKTDYKNQSDLSKFVKEYCKAQALINECTEFYRSFLLSNLKTYSQITKNPLSFSNYKFYELTLKPIKFEYTENTKLCNYKTVLEHFNAKKEYIETFCKDTGGNGVCSIFNISELMAGIEMEEKYKHDKKYDTYPHFTPTQSIDWSQSFIRYDIVNKADNTSKYSGHKDIFYKEFKELAETWLKKVIEYIGSNNIVYAFITYDDIRKTINELIKTSRYHKHFKNDKERKKYEKHIEDVNSNLYKALKWDVKINLFDYISVESLVNMASVYLKEYSENYKGFINAIQKVLSQNKAFNKYIKDQLHDAAMMINAVIQEFSNYDNEDLYIVDSKGNANMFCKLENINDVNISCNDKELICAYKYTYSKYCQFTRSYDRCDYTKTIIFDVNTNEVKSYKEDNSGNYKVEYSCDRCY